MITAQHRRWRNPPLEARPHMWPGPWTALCYLGRPLSLHWLGTHSLLCLFWSRDSPDQQRHCHLGTCQKCQFLCLGWTSGAGNSGSGPQKFVLMSNPGGFDMRWSERHAVSELEATAAAAQAGPSGLEKSPGRCLREETPVTPDPPVSWGVSPLEGLNWPEAPGGPHSSIPTMMTDPHRGGSDALELCCIYTASFSKELKVFGGGEETDRQTCALWRFRPLTRGQAWSGIHSCYRPLREAWPSGLGSGEPEQEGGPVT